MTFLSLDRRGEVSINKRPSTLLPSLLPSLLGSASRHSRPRLLLLEKQPSLSLSPSFSNPSLDCCRTGNELLSSTCRSSCCHVPSSVHVVSRIRSSRQLRGKRTHRTRKFRNHSQGPEEGGWHGEWKPSSFRSDVQERAQNERVRTTEKGGQRGYGLLLGWILIRGH